MESKIYEIFSIETDKSHHFTIDKIILHQSQTKEFLSLNAYDKDLQATGCFGSIQEVQIALSQIKIVIPSSIDIGKGKILAIQIKNKTCFCLIFQDNFFFNKPIDEKSIQLTLFRIFLDMVSIIHLCFNEQVYKFWYNDSLIPFSDVRIFKLQEFAFKNVLKEKIEEKTFNIQITKLDGIMTEQFMTPNIIFSKFSESTVDQQQNDFENEFLKIVNEMLNNYCCGNQPEQIQKAISINLKKTLDYLSQAFQDELKNYQGKSNFKSVDDQFKQKLQIQIQEQLKYLKPEFYNQYIFQFQRGKINVLREQQLMSSQVEQIQFELNEQTNIMIMNQKHQKRPIFKKYFRTKANNDIFIFYDEVKKQHLIYLLISNQADWKFLGSINNSKSGIFYMHYNNQTNYLFCFNVMEKYVALNEISEQGIQNQTNFCDQYDELSKEISVNYVGYLQFSKKFVILSDQFKLYTLCEITKKIHSQDLRVQNTQSTHNQTELYKQLLSCPSGNQFFLSNFQICDIFDCNFTQIMRIQIRNQLFIFSDYCDVFLVSMHSQQQDDAVMIKVLENVIESNQLTQVQMDSELKLVGNPAIDIIKGAIVKFGPILSSSWASNKKVVKLITKQKQHSKIIAEYLKKLNLIDFQISNSDKLQFSKEQYLYIQNNIFSSVSLQLCTVENGYLIPLIDGFSFKPGGFMSKKNSEIEQISKQLSLGFLEEYMSKIKEKIYVVSIIGKQSSGKSYLLNRIFGTRYSVAASRCTDGIWASLCYLEDQYFLVLDCEGLFSSQRTQNEEIKMLAFVTAISDMTLLNQDLTFNRYLKELLDNLSQASIQLEGETLFKGNLTIVIRDIASIDNNGVNEELIQNLNKQSSDNKQQGNFLIKLFNRKFYVQKLLNFELKKFDDQIVEMRNYFIQSSKNTVRWINGEQLKQTVKILLCQLQFSDKSNASILEEQEKVKKIINSYKQKCVIFFKTPPKLTKQNQLSKLSFEDLHSIRIVSINSENRNFVYNFLIFLLECQIAFLKNKKLFMKIIGKQLGILFHFRLTKFKLFLLSSKNSTDEIIYKWTINYFQIAFDLKNFQMKIKLQLKNQIKAHNQNIVLINQVQKDSLFEKKEIILKCLEEELSQASLSKQIKDFIFTQVLDFKYFLNQQLLNYTFCQNKCSECFLNCTQFKIHSLNFEKQLCKLDLEIQNSIQQLKDKFFNTITKIELSEIEKEINKLQNQIDYLQNLIKLNEISQNIEEERKPIFLKDEHEELQRFKNLENEIEKMNESLQINEGKLIAIWQQHSILDNYEKIFQFESLEKVIQEKLKRFQSGTKVFTSQNSLEDFLYTFRAYSSKLEQTEKSIVNAQIRLKKIQQNISADVLKTEEMENEIISEIRVLNNQLEQDYEPQISIIRELEMNEKVEISDIFSQYKKRSQEKEEKFQGQIEELSSLKQERAKTREQIYNLQRKLDQLIEYFIIKDSSLIDGFCNIKVYEQKKKEISEKLKQQRVNNQFYQNDLFEQNNQNQEQLQVMKARQYNLQEKKQKYFLKIELENKLNNLQIQRNNLMEKANHNCQKDNHKCDEKCCACKGKDCEQKAGHDGKHFCSLKQHSCSEQCQTPNCQEICTKEFDHKNIHVCSKFHQCDKKCNYCFNKCKIDITNQHQLHNCELTKCNQKCYLCGKFCKEKHEHSQEEEHNKHICGENEHQCLKLCEQKGICKINYSQTEKVWNSNLSEITYINYTQTDAGKQRCCKIITQNCNNFVHQHYCQPESESQFHTCDQQCPECSAFCTFKFGHQGLHDTHQHRNKENQIFTLQVGINLNIEIDNTRIYKVNDSAQPETCSQSCKRRGRSHFHLVECKGGNNCLEKLEEFKDKAKHAQVQYQGFEGCKFDEILCNQFWQHKKWVHPLQRSGQLEIIQKCNHFCSLCNDEQQFCTQQAWHTQSNKYYDHTFLCYYKHEKNEISMLNICFVLDSTTSMDYYLQQSVYVVQEIMQRAENHKMRNGEPIPIEFAVITFKDHEYPYEENDHEVVKVQDFTDQLTTIEFLKTIKASGGNDVPEAVLDGLNAAINLNWKEDSEKILYLVTDAPPHGKNKLKTRAYHNFWDESYPDGCPCGLTQSSILNRFKKLNLKFKIIKLNSDIELMIAEFMKEYTSLEVLNLQKSNLFVPIVVEDVTKVVKINEITYQQKK